MRELEVYNAIFSEMNESSIKVEFCLVNRFKIDALVMEWFLLFCIYIYCQFDEMKHFRMNSIVCSKSENLFLSFGYFLFYFFNISYLHKKKLFLFFVLFFEIFTYSHDIIYMKPLFEINSENHVL